MTNHSLRVAIIGAGIGGLTLGLGSSGARYPRRDLREPRPNSPRSAQRLPSPPTPPRCFAGSACWSSSPTVATSPTELIYRDGRTGSRIAGQPVRNDGWYEAKFGAPYYGVHRADLQRVLGDAFGSQGPAPGLPGWRTSPRTPTRSTSSSPNGRTASADIVIGADGIRSSSELGQRQATTSSTPAPADSAASSRMDKPALAARPRSHPVLDGTRRPPAALPDRRRTRRT